MERKECIDNLFKDIKNIQETKEKVLEFINRRFPNDSNWLTGNCYHFALILADVFGGEIWYDIGIGHFVTKIGVEFYDYNGISRSKDIRVKWSAYEDYDGQEKEIIIRDCIK